MEDISKKKKKKKRKNNKYLYGAAKYGGNPIDIHPQDVDTIFEKLCTNVKKPKEY